MIRLAIALTWLLHLLPMRLLAALGDAFGMLGYALARERRMVGRTNLALCFPEIPAAQRERILRRQFRRFARGLLDSTVAWWGSPERIRRVARIEGEEHLKSALRGPVIILVPHFAGLDVEGIRITLDYAGMAVYSHQKNRKFDRFLLERRSRFPGSHMLSRLEGVKAIVRGFKKGLNMQLSPDLDLGPTDAVFVPFFGVKAATITALPRLAKLVGARVVPLITVQQPPGQGYLLRFYPPWENFPSGDVEADVRRMNAFIEERVRELPEHYMWLHKRFKTRPPGEERFY